MSHRQEVAITPQSEDSPAIGLPETVHQRATQCRICGSGNLIDVLSLGPTPLANAFPSNPDEFESEKSFPLDVAFCSECSLVQIVDAIDPAVMFRDYIYVTGTSRTIADHNVAYAASVRDQLALSSDDLVVEVASNDGSLLNCFRDLGIGVLGVEPARNIALVAREAGIETVSEFFGSSLAEELRTRFGPAKAVVGNNVLAHVPDPTDFLTGAAALLHDDGAVFIEVPYLGEFVDRLEYDTVYHEHLCYFSITALLRLCNQAGLSVLKVDRFPVHGGTIRIRAGLRSTHTDHATDVLAMAEAEAAAGLTSEARYRAFAAQVKNNREKLIDLLESIRASGKRIAGYGAPAKGNTLLNYCGIGPELLPFIVDQNPRKVGRYTPGSHIPVKDPAALEDFDPDYVFILAWNFADEIMRNLEAFKANGGQFIIPIPEPRII